MEEQRLTTDLMDTTSVYPRIEAYRLEADFYRGILESGKLGEDERKAIQTVVDAASAKLAAAVVAPDEPTVTIGFIPPQKLTSIRDRRAIVNREDKTPENMDKRSELDRELVRWGVRGHSGVRVRGKEIPWAAKTEKVRGKDFQTADPDVVDAYEALGWLPEHYPHHGVLPWLVMKFNSLEDGTKKKS